MVDVGGNNRPPSSHFRTYKLRCDLLGQVLREAPEHLGRVRPASGARVLVRQRVALRALRQLFAQLFQALVLANGDVLHLRRDDPLLCIPKLRDGVSAGGPQRGPTCRRGRTQRRALTRTLGAGGRMRFRQKAIVLRCFAAARVLLHVGACPNPLSAQRRQSLLHASLKLRVAPRPRGVVHKNRRVLLYRTIWQAGGCQRNLAHRDAHTGMELPLQIDPPRIRKRISALRMQCVRSCVHKKRPLVGGKPKPIGDSRQSGKKRRRCGPCDPPSPEETRSMSFWGEARNESQRTRRS